MCNCAKKMGGGPAPSQPAPPRRMLRAAAAPPSAPAAPVQTFPENAEPTVWGPPVWKALHIAAQFSGTSNHISPWRLVVEAMKTGLPCSECRDHFNARVAQVPLRFSNMFTGFRHNRVAVRTTVINWTTNLHNFVNTANGKPSWSLQEVATAYGGDRASRIVEARDALETVNGVLGDNLYQALRSLLDLLGN